MKVLRTLLTGLAVCLIFYASAALAQPPASPCNPCETFCSWTQGGWGAGCNGGNVGCLRDEFFNQIYPNGVSIGHAYPNVNYWLHFTSSLAVENFLPQGSTSAPLTQNQIDPPQTPHISVFAGQVLALQLNVDFSAYPPTGIPPLGGLVIASGPFAGWTVNQLLALGNDVLGGNLGALPAGVTIDDLNDACGAVNLNFDDCVQNDHYLITPPAGATVYVRNVGDPLPLNFCLTFTAQCPDICVIWWCQGCLPEHDFATFSAVPGCSGPNCNEDCTPSTGVLTGFEWENQHVIQPDGSGNGCWWYALVHSTAPGCFCVTFETQLPVEFSSAFEATAGNSEVNLNWATASERGNDYFNIQRSTDGTSWNTIGAVDGQGTVSNTTNYSFADRDVTNGVNYTYKLLTVDMSGNVTEAATASATPKDGSALPKEFSLYQNYPNPFNPSTSISFDVPMNSHVTLRVYNMIGEEVATLVNGNLNAGSHSITFDASKLPSALYIYRLDAPGFSASHKMLLLK